MGDLIAKDNFLTIPIHRKHIPRGKRPLHGIQTEYKHPILRYELHSIIFQLQLRFCYEVLAKFIESFEGYSNIIATD